MKFLFIVMLIIFPLHCQTSTIMINPAGDAQMVGRKLSQGYERGETLKCAQALQEKLEGQHNIQTLLARSPGEQAPHLYVASFANRLEVDFFLSLNIYREKAIKPKIYIYQLAYHPFIDFAPRNIDPMALIPFHQAHFKNIHITKKYASRMHEILNQEAYHKQFDCLKPAKIPLKPLSGITPPAIAIEIGIQQDGQWQSLIEALVESIKVIFG